MTYKVFGGTLNLDQLNSFYEDQVSCVLGSLEVSALMATYPCKEEKKEDQVDYPYGMQ